MITNVDGRYRVQLPDGTLDKGRFHHQADAQAHYDVLLARRVLASLPYIRPHDTELALLAASFHWAAQYVRID